MDPINLLTGFLALISITATIASLLRWDYWWIRMFDFPRLQISFINLGAIVLLLVQVLDLEIWELILLGVLFITLIYQLVKIFPYTFFSPIQVKPYKGKVDDRTISLLISNVLTTNNKYSSLIQLVRKYRPDIVLTLESDRNWEKALEVLEKDYPFTVKVPLDNFYGMHLYSKLETKDMEVMYLFDEEIPSIHGEIVLKSGDMVHIHCLHPMPPSPTECDTSTDRDAELLLVGKNIDTDSGPELVFGDLNDVAWSRTTKLFQKLSGLLDPRIGRGFFNTFHAGNFLLRWPLDHVFHSNDFTVKRIKRLENIGSDHFPMFISLHLEPRAKQQQEEPDADQDEEEWADEKIDKANQKEKLD